MRKAAFWPIFGGNQMKMKLKQACLLIVTFITIVKPIFAQTGCTDFQTSDFKKVDLVTGISSPMKMKIAEDGRVFYIQRSGEVMMLKPGMTTPVKILTIPVSNGSLNEDGVLGIALDPKFSANNWIYIYHSVISPMGFHLSRYTLMGDLLDVNSEKVVLNIPHLYTQYPLAGTDHYDSVIIHAAGAIAFDPAGNLLITTGDLQITNSTFAIPVVENSFNFDAQRTSANTNSLFGKILRISPKDDGTYTIPSGNLFAVGTALTRPEIYAMGVRNPFTLTIDPKTGWAYSGEVGPDNETQNISSQDEVNQIKNAGNFGWPYITGNNMAYTSPSFIKYDTANLVNNSKNNTGMNKLPPSVRSLFWFSNTESWPITGIVPNPNPKNRCIKVGGFYRFNPSGTNAKRLPPSMDNGFFMSNHNNVEDLRFFKLNDNGLLVSIKTVLGGMARMMSAEIGPDGSLYTLEWGGDNGHWFNQSNGKLSRIDYMGVCSTTSLARNFTTPKNGKNVLELVTDGKINFPEWANAVTAYSLSGEKLFSISKSRTAPSGSPIEVQKSFQKSLLILKYSHE